MSRHDFAVSEWMSQMGSLPDPLDLVRPIPGSLQSTAAKPVPFSRIPSHLRGAVDEADQEVWFDTIPAGLESLLNFGDTEALRRT